MSCEMKGAFLILALVLVAQPQSADLTVSTIPSRIFKENDGVVDAADSETFIFWIVVKGTGPAPEPLRAEVQLFSGAERIGTHSLAAPFLNGVRGVSFTRRFIEETELFDLRHHFSLPVSVDVNRVVYTLTVAMPRGEVTRTVEFAVQRYQPRTELIFPLPGPFLIVAGHDANEPHRGGWNQQFAYDAVSVGPDFGFARNGGRSNEDFFTWGRNVVAPGDGTVVYARNDVPDQPTPGTVDRSYLNLRDPLHAVAGNNVLIDHGNGEYSSLGHLQHGSVRAKVGDTVTRGQVIGKVGSSGPSEHPHLHYQLMSGTHLTRSDGLPSQFVNVWLEDTRAREPVQIKVPKRGIQLVAR
jgi:hypothetical protein